MNFEGHWSKALAPQNRVKPCPLQVNHCPKPQLVFSPGRKQASQRLRWVCWGLKKTGQMGYDGMTRQHRILNLSQPYKHMILFGDEGRLSQWFVPAFFVIGAGGPLSTPTSSQKPQETENVSNEIFVHQIDKPWSQFRSNLKGKALRVPLLLTLICKNRTRTGKVCSTDINLT